MFGMEAKPTTDRAAQLRVHIRWMIRRDLPEVLQIEEDGFEFPWTEREIMDALRQQNCIGMVAEQGERVVGFMIYKLYPKHLHLVSLAVARDCQRRGVGRLMVDKLVEKLTRQRRVRITLETRETNLAAQLFFRSQGFRATAVFHEFYADSPEDAYLMVYRPQDLVGVGE